MQTKTELVLEQTQQGASDEILVSIEGVKELEGNVRIKGVKKEALHTLRQKLGFHMEDGNDLNRQQLCGSWLVLILGSKSLKMSDGLRVLTVVRRDGLFERTVRPYDCLVMFDDEKAIMTEIVLFLEEMRDRYGYVYLLKHKHEVFKTFKVFQKEVENQLVKTIKSLRSDRGGEYMSQEFLDHLNEHGIIAHRTPPYTPQHNRVSERRNQTLLDMVRSMMSQTTLPKFFWDYALESAAHILNMVPTKKVDKTPYEIWHGQAPKLSYLKVWGCEALVKRDTLVNNYCKQT
ncbi:retrotransposon protein, putative, ty1-copia subclass [Tanacetum coccineum]|uniref:Retrotransposon protein, putative, ty1-copia subclass n=1 Tax=Tanacetum coccineum TaxID=301880 RepID=A0ABQ5EZN5_9ASTR